MSKLVKKITSQILFILALAFSISAQENQPQLLDEFGKLSNDDLNARLDNLAFEISKIPKSKALVRIYGGEGGNSYVRGSWIKSVWTVNRKNPPEKLLIQFCNINKEPRRTRFFVVRENDKVEVCEESLFAPSATALFETIYFAQPDFELVPMEDTFIYVDAASQGEYSRFAQDALKRLLIVSPQSRVYLVVYLQTNFETDFKGKITSRKTSLLDKKSLTAKMLGSAKDNLLKNGFLPSQIVALDGGYVNGNERRLEFWFVPKGGEIPKPKPDYFPKKRRRK
jgi:hypothetical protein